MKQARRSARITRRGFVRSPAAGVAAIELINLVRVVSLWWVGRHHPALFQSSHTVIWQSIVVLFGVVLFFLWAARQPRPAPAEG